MGYKDYLTYKVLERIIEDAGVKILYGHVPDDHIDGAIWARSDIDSMSILMPEDEAFPSDEKACLILGHEMGHLLADIDSPDDPVMRQRNEAICDLIGVALYKLADMTAGYILDKSFEE